MTKAQLTFSDEELTAYLDGEAEAALASSIEDAVGRDAQLAGRLAALEIPIDAVRAAFALPELDPPERPAVAVPSRQVPWGMAASVALALGLGALGGYGLRPDVPVADAPVVAAEKPSWITAVAAYQALYAPETLDGPAQTAARTAVVLAGFKDALGVDLHAATQSGALKFKRAQILSYSGKPLMQMAYVDDQGRPFALCVISTAKEGRELKDQMARGLAASSWIADGIGYLVIGGTDKDATRAHAQDLQARLAQG